MPVSVDPASAAINLANYVEKAMEHDDFAGGIIVHNKSEFDLHAVTGTGAWLGTDSFLSDVFVHWNEPLPATIKSGETGYASYGGAHKGPATVEAILGFHTDRFGRHHRYAATFVIYILTVHVHEDERSYECFIVPVLSELPISQIDGLHVGKASEKVRTMLKNGDAHLPLANDPKAVTIARSKGSTEASRAHLKLTEGNTIKATATFTAGKTFRIDIDIDVT